MIIKNSQVIYSHSAMVIKSFEEIYNEADQKLKIKDKVLYIEH